MVIISVIFLPALCVALVASVAVNYTVSRVVIFARPKGGEDSHGERFEETDQHHRTMLQ